MVQKGHPLRGPFHAERVNGGKDRVLIGGGKVSEKKKGLVCGEEMKIDTRTQDEKNEIGVNA